VLVPLTCVTMRMLPAAAITGLALLGLPPGPLLKISSDTTGPGVGVGGVGVGVGVGVGGGVGLGVL